MLIAESQDAEGLGKKEAPPLPRGGYAWFPGPPMRSWAEAALPWPPEHRVGQPGLWAPEHSFCDQEVELDQVLLPATPALELFLKHAEGGDLSLSQVPRGAGLYPPCCWSAVPVPAVPKSLGTHPENADSMHFPRTVVQS